MKKHKMKHEIKETSYIDSLKGMSLRDLKTMSLQERKRWAARNSWWKGRTVKLGQKTMYGLKGL